MNGFCYDYCKPLFEKLKQLVATDRFFKRGNKAAIDASQYGHDMTQIAAAVVDAISQQTNLKRLPDGTTFSKMKEFLAASEEFLAIFEKDSAGAEAGWDA